MLIPVAIALPQHFVEVEVGDVDGDGIEDLILVSHVPQGQEPDAVTLTVVMLDALGAETRRRSLSLGNSPLVWDVWGGLWAYDAAGLLRLDLEGGAAERIALLPTALAGLGPTTPIKGRFAMDLGEGGGPSLVVHSGGEYHVYQTDGAALGAVPAPVQGELREEGRAGGLQLRTVLEPPSLATGDVDGDGLVDLMLPRGDELAVFFGSADGFGSEAVILPLPVDLSPREDQKPRKGEERRRITRVWLQDLNGDGRVDLGLHQMVMKGSWFGTNAELIFAAGHGRGFESPQIVACDSASFLAMVLDADGDGDKDLLVPQMDTGLTALGRALVTRSLPVDLDLFEMADGLYKRDSRTLLSVSQQVEGGDDRGWAYGEDSDVDGDGLPDLVRHEGGEQGLLIFLGKDGFSGSKPSWETDVPLPEAGRLMVHDLTGDGRAEVMLWAPHALQGTLLLHR